MFDQFKTSLLFVYHLHLLGRVIALYQKGFLNRKRTMQLICQYVILVCCLEKFESQVIPVCNVTDRKRVYKCICTAQRSSSRDCAYLSAHVPLPEPEK